MRGRGRGEGERDKRSRLWLNIRLICIRRHDTLFIPLWQRRRRTAICVHPRKGLGGSVIYLDGEYDPADNKDLLNIRAAERARAESRRHKPSSETKWVLRGGNCGLGINIFPRRRRLCTRVFPFISRCERPLHRWIADVGLFNIRRRFTWDWYDNARKMRVRALHKRVNFVLTVRRMREKEREGRKKERNDHLTISVFFNFSLRKASSSPISLVSSSRNYR